MRHYRECHGLQDPSAEFGIGVKPKAVAERTGLLPWRSIAAATLGLLVIGLLLWATTRARGDEAECSKNTDVFIALPQGDSTLALTETHQRSTSDAAVAKSDNSSGALTRTGGSQRPPYLARRVIERCGRTLGAPAEFSSQTSLDAKSSAQSAGKTLPASNMSTPVASETSSQESPTTTATSTASAGSGTSPESARTYLTRRLIERWQPNTSTHANCADMSGDVSSATGAKHKTSAKNAEASRNTTDSTERVIERWGQTTALPAKAYGARNTSVKQAVGCTSSTATTASATSTTTTTGASAEKASPTGNVASLLLQDANTSARLVPEILSRRPSIADGELYDMAWAMAREERNETERMMERWQTVTPEDTDAPIVEEHLPLTTSLTAPQQSSGGVAETHNARSLLPIDLILIDAKTAATIVPLMLRLKPDLSQSLQYDISLAVARWSRNNDLRPELVVALINQESTFNPHARSRTNDHGLMQLNSRPIYGISENVEAGCLHFAGNMKAAGRNEREALATYNGGPKYPPISLRYADSILAIAGGAE